MIQFNRTKIVATIGPATSSKEMLRKIIERGVDVCRLNFSHSSYDEHKKVLNYIREINDELDTNIAVLADLQGPKLRIGTVEDGIELKEGEKICFTTQPCNGTKDKVFITYPDFPKDVRPGEKVLVDDGKIVLLVESTNGKDEVVMTITHGGPLHSKKGVNLPNTRTSLPCLTDKDKADLQFALENDVEWIGLSFVRSASDIQELRAIINNSGKPNPPKIIAKIEKPEALTDIDNIIAATDGIMVARGDLGVEVPIEQVPHIQKMLVAKSIEASKPVIIATQMLESMIENVTPSRAEVTDIANAVLDGANAVMLSGETSVGNHPHLVIDTMQKIIAEAEKDNDIYYKHCKAEKKHGERYISDVICHAACSIAQETDAAAIITMTHSGYTAFHLSAQRPKSRIFVFTDNKPLLKTLNLLWGVEAYHYDKMVSTDHSIREIKGILKEKGLLKEGDLVVSLSTIPLPKKGKTNMLKLSYVE